MFRQVRESIQMIRESNSHNKIMLIRLAKYQMVIIGLYIRCELLILQQVKL